MTDLENHILELVRRKHDVSFVELEDLFSELKLDYHGNCSILLNEAKQSNITIWQGWAPEYTACVIGLLKKEQLVVKPTSPLIYIIDGAVIRQPVAKSMRHYKHPHWLPVVLDIRMN